MDNARGGFFDKISDQYPAGAWFTRYDCDYSCLVDEHYWAAITRAGMMEGRVTGIPRDRDGEGDEWAIETAQELMERDPKVYEILDRSEFNFPSVAPDGSYRD